MHTTEHTDLDGDALTVHRDKGLAWVTITRDGDELTVGPVPAHALTEQHHSSHTRDEKRNAESRPLTPDTMTAREYLDAAWEAAYEPECGNVPKGACFLTKSATGVHVRVATEAFGAHGVRLLDSPTPARPDWLDAPAVRVVTEEQP